MGRRWLTWPLVGAAVLAALLAIAAPGARADTCASARNGSASGLLLISPAPRLSPTLPIGQTVTVVVTPLVDHPSGDVHFAVCGTNSSVVHSGAARPLDVDLSHASATRSAEFTYTDQHGAGSDTIVATYRDRGRTLVAKTTLTWAKPATGCPIGLPSLLNALGCSAAGRFVGTAYNTGACLSQFVAISKLLDLLKLADAAKLGEAASQTSLGRLAHDLVELEEDGVSFRSLLTTVEDAHNVKELISSLATLMKNVARSGDANEVALDLASVIGLKPCVNLLVGSIGAPPAPKLPPTPPSIPSILGLWNFPNPVAADGDTTPREVEFIRGPNGDVEADGVTLAGDRCPLTSGYAFVDFALQSNGDWTGKAGWITGSGCGELGAWPSAMRVLTDAAGKQTLVQCSDPPGTLTEPSISPSGSGSPGADCWTSAVRPAGEWGSATDLGAGPLGSAPTAGGDPASQQFVFWQGTDGTLWDQWTLGSAAWNGPARIVAAGHLGSAPAVAVGAAAQQYVFWKGTDGNLWESWHTTSWHPAISLGAGPLGSGPTAGADKAGDQFVFWEGTDHHLWDKWFSDGAWHGPARILAAGTIGSAPAVAVTPSGVQHVFWRGTDGNLWETTYNDGWGPPVNLGAGPLGSAPTAGADAYGRIYVFWRGTNGSLWERWFTNERWHGPVPITAAGIMGSAPTVAVEASGEQDVFWKGSNGDLWETMHP
jgi:hypothetical protein